MTINATTISVGTSGLRRLLVGELVELGLLPKGLSGPDVTSTSSLAAVDTMMTTTLQQLVAFNRAGA